MKTQGMTLIEILITILIIGMVAAIAIPAVTQFGEDTREKVCRQNLRTIDNTKLQWAIDKNQPDDAEPTEEDLAEYIRGNFPQAVVAGALYKIGSVITPALCSYHGNSFTEGFGMTYKGLSELVKEGKLNASEVMDRNWKWSRESEVKAWYSGGFLATNSWRRWGDPYVKPDGTEVECYVHDDPRVITNPFDREEHKDVVFGNVDPHPKIIVNGKVLEGDRISYYAEEYMRLNKEYNEAKASEGSWDNHFQSKMAEGGGYTVLNYNIPKGRKYNSNLTYAFTKCYYDHKGNLIGYQEYDYRGYKHRKNRHYYYDSEGNLLN